jgi:hypothetical protein
MTPYKSHGRGTFEIDLRFAGVGRIHRASGTNDRKLLDELKVMCRTLYKAGRRDVLLALRDGKMSFLEVYSHFRLGEWERIPSAETMMSVDKVVDPWLERIDCSAAHRASLRRSWDELKALAPANPTLEDVPGMVRAFRDAKEGKHHRTYNLARTAAQALVRDKLGKDHRLWYAIAGIPTLRESRKKGNPCTIDEARALAVELGRKAGAIWWTMCTTGMGRLEYWQQEGSTWEVDGDAVRIHGTKRPGRDRIVPRISVPVRPELTYWGMRQALRRAECLQTVRDGRRSYANILEEAGITRTRRRLYMGHTTRDVLDLYEDHDVRKYIQDDGDRLRELLGAPIMWKVA